MKIFDATVKKDPKTGNFSRMNMNNSDKKPSNDLIISLNELDPSAKYLDLSANEFGACDATFLLQIAHSVPETIEFLDLSFNDLGKLDIDVLVDFLRALPSSICTLNLSHNELGKLSIEQIQQINDALPNLQVDISSNYLEKLGILADVTKIFADSGKTIISYREKTEQDATLRLTL